MDQNKDLIESRLDPCDRQVNAIEVCPPALSLSRRLKDWVLRLVFPLDHFLARIVLRLFGDRPSIICLMFHCLAPDSQAPGFDPGRHLTVEQFRCIVRYFKKADFCFLGLDDLEGPLDPSGRYVMLTFDDGNASDLEALKILAEERVPGSFFITTGRLVADKGQDYDFRAPLSWNGLHVLGAHPLAHIGNHGHTHTEMSALTEEVLAREIVMSQALLAELPRQNPYALAFPYGAWSPNVLRLLRRHGFSVLFDAAPGRNQITIRQPQSGIWFYRFALRPDIDLDAQCSVLRIGRPVSTAFSRMKRQNPGPSLV